MRKTGSKGSHHPRSVSGSNGVGRRRVKSVRVILGCTHSVLRAGLRRLMEAMPRAVIVAEAASGREILSLSLHHLPEVVLLDARLVEDSGSSLIHRLHESVATIRIILLAVQTDQESATQAFKAGVAGLVCERATIDEFRQVFEQVVQGRTAVSSSSLKAAGKAAKQPGGKSGTSSVSQLTPRQREILRLIAEGNTTKEIAFELEVSVKTVETHRSHLMERLKIYNVPGLVRYAMRVGLVSMDV